MEKDPVCGMELEEGKTRYYTHYRHETFYFCSKICKQSFDMDRGLDRRSGWRRWVDRIIEANRTLFGETPPQVLHGGARHTLPLHRVNLVKTGLVTDPVCRMQIHKGTAAATRQYKGETYYFCAVDCGNRFDAHPEIYTGGMKNSYEGNETQGD